MAQTNIDGAVTTSGAAANLTDKQLVIGSGGSKVVTTLAAATNGQILTQVGGIPA